VLTRDARADRPRLSPQERAVLTAYASGATLAAAARRAGVAYGTAREYLERVKRKYAEVGRPTRTKLELADRVREDRLDLGGPGR
ncbi:DNA-binding response regulator, partial [Micromonospora chalcea]